MFLVFPPVFRLAVIENKIEPKTKNQNHAHNTKEPQGNIQTGEYRKNSQENENRNRENSYGLPPRIKTAYHYNNYGKSDKEQKQHHSGQAIKFLLGVINFVYKENIFAF
jgi:hypothetical protein